MKNGNGSAVWRPVAGALLGILNAMVVIGIGFILNEQREIRREMRTAIDRLEERNKIQDDLVNNLSIGGFERLGKVEAVIEEHERRLEHLDGAKMRSPGRSDVSP